MKLQKAELAQKLNKIKGVVPRKTDMSVLKGVLVKDNYLTANNLEMAVKVKIEGTDGESFLIPERAFDLINNLPDGDVEILEEKDRLTIKADKIKNEYQTLDCTMFPETAVQEDESELTIKAEILLESIRHVAYAVPAQNPNATLTAMCLHASRGQLNFVGLDGYMAAWDKVGYNGEFDLLIPKQTVDKLKSIGFCGDVKIKHNQTSAVFITEDIEVHTRLIEGKYFEYQKIFRDLPLHTVVSRTELLNAMTRAKMCTEERCPVRFELDGNSLSLNIKDSTTDYHETIELQEEIAEKLTIGFDARRVLETLKAFDCENVGISFESAKMPMIVESEDSDFKAIILPVLLRE